MFTVGTVIMQAYNRTVHDHELLNTFWEYTATYACAKFPYLLGGKQRHVGNTGTRCTRVTSWCKKQKI